MIIVEYDKHKHKHTHTSLKSRHVLLMSAERNGVDPGVELLQVLLVHGQVRGGCSGAFSQMNEPAVLIGCWLPRRLRQLRSSRRAASVHRVSGGRCIAGGRRFTARYVLHVLFVRCSHYNSTDLCSLLLLRPQCKAGQCAAPGYLHHGRPLTRSHA